MSKVEFVSYDGEYPNLCSGNLVVRIDGEEINFGMCLRSGGGVSFDENWHEHVWEGPWYFRHGEPLELTQDLKDEIIEQVNEHVKPGCCGGCI